MLPHRLLVLLALAVGWSAWLLSGPAAAAPAAPIVSELQQPNGRGFAARQWGDEHAHGWETTDGYSVVVDRDSGFWEYGIPGAHGRLVASGRRPGHEPPPGPRHLRPQPTEDASVGPVARAPSADGGGSTGTGSMVASPSYSSMAVGRHVGTERSLVLLVHFDDQRPTTTVSDWSGRYFGSHNSVRDYFDEVSYGAFTFAPARDARGRDDGVVGWLNLGPRHPDFELLGQSVRWATQAEVTAAALRAANPYVRFGRYDTNGNGRLEKEELHVTVIVAGREASYGWGDLDNAVWAHQADLFSWGLGQRLDGVFVGDGYTMFGEKHDRHLATLGVMVHEMGHDIDWPDLYNTRFGTEGVGTWSIMGTGAWLSTGGHMGSKPSHPDAFSKYYQGWLDPVLVEGTRSVTLGRSSAPSAPTVVRLRRNPNGVDWSFLEHSGQGEYFLVENRQLSGYDAGLPGCGLLVWHIDEDRTPSNYANATTDHKLVDLEEADGRDHLDANRLADAGDAFNGDVSGFRRSTRPNSDLYSGALSGVAVTDVSSRNCSSPGAMTAQFKGPSS